MADAIPARMAAVFLCGHGGPEKLEYREDVPTPEPGAGEVLVRVASAGMNNTDINTRIGWYSKQVTSDTGTGSGQGFSVADQADSAWSGGAIRFPRIQGADCCGYIAACGAGVPASRLNERVLVRSIMRVPAENDIVCITLGSEIDGAFAQYVKVPARHAFAIESDWTDVELASIPCAWSTAENLLHRAGLGAERVLITGASGGVGSAAVQLAKRRGAEVLAICGREKMDQVQKFGADTTIARDADLLAETGRESVDVVIDLVGGPGWPALLEIMKKGGRYACAGAIAGPMVELDMRTLYLKDLSLLGCTCQEDIIFENLVSYIEGNEIRPLVSATYPLAEIASAQEDFLAKKFAGKLVLVPPD